MHVIQELDLPNYKHQGAGITLGQPGSERPELGTSLEGPRESDLLPLRDIWRTIANIWILLPVMLLLTWTTRTGHVKSSKMNSPRSIHCFVKESKQQELRRLSSFLSNFQNLKFRTSIKLYNIAMHSPSQAVWGRWCSFHNTIQGFSAANSWIMRGTWFVYA